MNPYSGYGAIVTGERLVGRRVELEQLEQRLSAGAGSISVIGEPRIGKSSLVNAVSDRIRSTTAMPVAWIDTSTLPGSTELFVEITSEILADAERNHQKIPPEVARIVSPGPTSSYDAYRQCRLCLTLLNRGGIKQVAIFDEFDAIRGFPDAAVTIQRLRDLIYRRFETGLSAVFVSRRTLRNIEQQLADVSTLDNVCEQFSVRPFDESTLWLLADRCGDEWQMVDDDKRQLLQYSGGHPYIAEMILCNALPTRSIRAGCDVVIASIYEYYQHLQRLLQEDGLFEQLIQIVVGPRWSIRLGSLELLQRYGVVRHTKTLESSRYEGWSQHFQLYLEKCARDGVLWALWHDTESAVRERIQEECEQAHGNGWIDTLASRHGSVATIFDACRTRRERKDRTSDWRLALIF